MKKLLFTALIVSISFLFSCTKENKQEAVLSSMQEVDTTYMKRSVLLEIRKYIHENPDAKCYLLKSMGLHKEKPSRDYYEGVENELFIIDKVSTYDISKNGENLLATIYPSRYFRLDDKIIFFSTEADAIMNQSILEKEFNNYAKQEDSESSNRKYILVSYFTDLCTVIDDPFADNSIQVIKEPIKHRIEFHAPLIIEE